MPDLKSEKRRNKKPLWPWIIALIAMIIIFWYLSTLEKQDPHPVDNEMTDTIGPPSEHTVLMINPLMINE